MVSDMVSAPKLTFNLDEDDADDDDDDGDAIIDKSSVRFTESLISDSRAGILSSIDAIS